MTFVKDLNSGKYDEKDEFTEAQLNWAKRVFKEVLTNTAIEARRKGQRSVNGYLECSSYNNNNLSIEQNVRYPTWLELDTRHIERNREIIEVCLKELGFQNYSVRIIDLQLWKQVHGFFREYKYVKNGTQKTIWIEYSW